MIWKLCISLFRQDEKNMAQKKCGIPTCNCHQLHMFGNISYYPICEELNLLNKEPDFVGDANLNKTEPNPRKRRKSISTKKLLRKIGKYCVSIQLITADEQSRVKVEKLYRKLSRKLQK